MIKWSTENDINSFKLIQIYAYNDESSFYARKIDNKTSLNIILVPWCTFIFLPSASPKYIFLSFFISSLPYSWCPKFYFWEFETTSAEIISFKDVHDLLPIFLLLSKTLIFLFFYVVDLSWILAAGISVFCYCIILWFTKIYRLWKTLNTLLGIYEKTCIKYIVDLCAKLLSKFNFYVRNRWI